MKKHIMACFICAMLCANEAYALVPGDIREKTIGVSGKTDANTAVSAAVSDAENTYYFYDEIISDKDGGYTLKFELPETLKNKEITVSVKPQGKTEEAVSFAFSGAAVREEALQKCIDSLSDKAVLSDTLSDADYKTAFEMEGIDIDKLNANAAVKNEALDILAERNPNADNFYIELNRCFFVCSKKNNYTEGAAAAFGGCEFEFEQVPFSKETDENKKQFIKSNMLSRGGIAAVEDAEKAYKTISAYYLVNNAKYSDIPNLLGRYSSELEVAGTAAYLSFSALSEKDKYLTAEKLVSLPEFGSLTGGLDALLAKSITKSETGGGTTGGGSSGGGGGGSRNSSAADTAVGIISPNNQNKSFDDIENGAWYKEAVEELFSKGVVSGRDEKNFAPDDNVKREEFIAMLMRAINAGDAAEAEIEFSDVKSGAWYESIIKKAVTLNIVSGYGDGRFGAGDLITRQDAAVFAARAAKMMNFGLSSDRGEAFADDADISDYAKDSVYAMKNENIISGMGENMYNPNANCTRAQAAVIVYRLLKGGSGK